MTRLRDAVSPVYRGVRALGSWLLRSYYPDLVVEGADRIPYGPLIIAANHPNSLVDPVVLSVALPRRVHWLAKATLFEGRLGRAVLKGLGAIPVHRRHEGGTRDTTRELLRTAADTLLEGKAIGIFPEGMTHDELRLKTLKTGASRIAVLAARDLAASGSPTRVHVAPVVLYFPQKTRFRSSALVLAGAPIEVSPHDEPEQLAETLRSRLEEMLVHVEDGEQERLLSAVRVLIQRRHALGGDTADPREAHRVDREIAMAIRRFAREEPERVAAFRERLYAYCERLDRHGFSLHALEPAEAEVHRSALAVACLPVAVFGLLHSWIPFKLAQWSSKRLSRQSDRTSISTFGVGSGIVLFPLCWLPWAWYAHAGWGAAGAALFLMSAPITALIARWSLHVLRHDIGRVGDTLLTAMRPHAVQDLRQERTWLWGEIERWRVLHFGGRAEQAQAENERGQA